MFSSFFPKHKLFFISFLILSLLSIAFWYAGGNNLYTHFGFSLPDPEHPMIGVKVFYSPAFLWFDLYYWSLALIFYSIWSLIAKNPLMNWSILGSALILFITYVQVQVSVAVNSWYGPFYDLVQQALSHSGSVTLPQFYKEIVTFSFIAFFAVVIGVFSRFFVSHYIFRWRTAMNNFYMDHWLQLRQIEGAAQRVQEDTMRFSSATEDLGVSFINSFMTLIAFLPVLLVLSEKIKTIPVLGEVSHPLVLAAIFWSLFGTVFLALIGVKLPGLQFNNQKVEASYRKELVYGEDNVNRAQPQTIQELFSDVRKNYFRLYFHYAYFNMGRIVYLQADIIFPYLILAPSIVGGVITLGLLNQILNSFDHVRSSFQYLVSSWTDIVEWLSIYKRLRAFEKSIH